MKEIKITNELVIDIMLVSAIVILILTLVFPPVYKVWKENLDNQNIEIKRNSAEK